MPAQSADTDLLREPPSPRANMCPPGPAFDRGIEREILTNARLCDPKCNRSLEVKVYLEQPLGDGCVGIERWNADLMAGEKLLLRSEGQTTPGAALKLLLAKCPRPAQQASQTSTDARAMTVADLHEQIKANALVLFPLPRDRFQDSRPADLYNVVVVGGPELRAGIVAGSEKLILGPIRANTEEALQALLMLTANRLLAKLTTPEPRRRKPGLF